MKSTITPKTTPNHHNANSFPEKGTIKNTSATNWRQFYDANGALYYGNIITGESRWDPPPGIENNDNNDVTPETNKTKTTAATSESKIKSEISREAASASPSSVVSSPSSVAISQISSVAMSQDSNTNIQNLPVWLKFKNQFGKEYYYNTITSETQWDPPNTMAATTPAIADNKNNSSNQNNIDNDIDKNFETTIPRKVSTTILPINHHGRDNNPFWSVFTNIDNGKKYFFNSMTGDVRYTPPPPMIPGPPIGPPPPASLCSSLSATWKSPPPASSFCSSLSATLKSPSPIGLRPTENLEKSVKKDEQQQEEDGNNYNNDNKSDASINNLMGQILSLRDNPSQTTCDRNLVLHLLERYESLKQKGLTINIQLSNNDENQQESEGQGKEEEEQQMQVKREEIVSILTQHEENKKEYLDDKDQASESMIPKDDNVRNVNNMDQGEAKQQETRVSNEQLLSLLIHSEEKQEEYEGLDIKSQTSEMMIPKDNDNVSNSSGMVQGEEEKQQAQVKKEIASLPTQNEEKEEKEEGGEEESWDDEDQTNESMISKDDNDGIQVNPDGNNSEKKVDFLKDDPSDMTFGRRIALYMMDRYKWYNPKLGATTGNNRIYDKDEETASNYSNDKDQNDIIIDGHFRSSEIGHPVAVTPRDEGANLDKAWAYFEHVTLPRYNVYNKEESNKTYTSRIIDKFTSCWKQGTSLDIAEPGQDQIYTRLYHPFFASHSRLGDFGIGCGIYFSTLRAFCILTFVAGLINIPNMIYYSSEAYDASRGMANYIPLEMRASAICTDHEWVICTDCEVSPSFPGDRVRFYNERVRMTIGEFDIPLIRFGRKNDCDAATIQNGIITFATMIFIAVGILVINKLISMAEKTFGACRQNAQDYSIVIENPPSDAYLPEEWKQFFEANFEGAHVTCCTIGLNNDLLLQDLMQQRETMKKLEMMVDPGTSLDMFTLARISALIQQDRGTIGNLLKHVSPGIPELYAKIASINARIKGLVQLTYPVTNVFVTFETEKAQREVLKALSIGKFQALRNNNKVIQNDSYLFRNEHVLSVAEPDEPSAIRWNHLNTVVASKAKIEAFTVLATLIAIVSVVAITDVVDRISPRWSVVFIAVTNVLFPIVGNALVNMEKHSTESGREASLYWKISIFRWVNTALVFTITTPFNETVDYHDGIIMRVRGLFFAELTASTILQLIDIGGHFSRHFSAPRGRTQDKMNLSMSSGSGTFDLAERYTNMTKFLFLALWYSSIYPAGLFMCSISMLIIYYADRFSLMRSWKKPLNLGNEKIISTMNKKIFFPLCIFAMAFASSYFWSGFPYDNLCLKGTIGELNDFTSEYLTLGDYNNGTITNIPPNDYEYVDSPEPNITTFHINNDTEVYGHCSKRELLGRWVLPFVSSNQQEDGNVLWMTPEQQLVADIFGWTTLGIMILLILLFMFYIVQNIRSFFVGTIYKDRGEDNQDIHFSNVECISTYIPQVKSAIYPYPLLAANIDNVDKKLLEWSDGDRPHAFYDLTLDAKALAARLDENNKNNTETTTIATRGNIVFGPIAHWPQSPPPHAVTMGDF